MAKKKGGVLSRIAAGIKARGTQGAFRRQAEEAGESTMDYAHQVMHDPDRHTEKTERRAHLAQVFAKYRRH